MESVNGFAAYSMLLIAYAVEMYLKAGLAKAYFGCSEEMFARDIKSRFGHRLVSLANEISFPLTSNEEMHLVCLRDMMHL